MGYDPNEARDEAGRWTSGGAAGGGGAKLAQRAKDVAATGTVKTAPGSDGPSATKAPVLTDWQIAAMRPDNTEVANAEARWRLDETQPGRDLMEVAADFQMTMTGYYDVQDDARKLLDGKSTGNPERDRQIRTVIDAAREFPKDAIPQTLYRGMGIDDIDTFVKEHPAGSAVELGPTSFSSQFDMARRFSRPDDEGGGGEHPVIIEFDTTGGSQSLPLQNFARYPEMARMREYLTLGRFEVTQAPTLVDATPGHEYFPHYAMKIRQTGTY